MLDKQDVIAIIIILFGLGLTQLDKGSNSFYLGLGIGTVIMASVWVIIRIVKEFKKK